MAQQRYHLQRQQRAKLARILAYIFLSIGAAVMIIPFIWSISSSLKTAEKIFVFPPQWIPNPVKWQNYAIAWTSSTVPFGRFMLNSLFLALVVPSLQIFTSALAAYAFARLQFPGRDKFFLLFLGTMMIPGQVLVIPNFILMRYLGLVNSYAAVILPNMVTVFGTFLLRQYFLTLPYELEDAARIDGCSRFTTFYRIILPLAKPALATLAIFQFKTVWNMFMWPLIVLNDPTKYPIQVGLAYFKGIGEAETHWELLLAGANMAILPVIIVFFFGQRYFVRGMALSGMGGK